MDNTFTFTLILWKRARTRIPEICLSHITHHGYHFHFLTNKKGLDTFRKHTHFWDPLSPCCPLWKLLSMYFTNKLVVQRSSIIQLKSLVNSPLCIKTLLLSLTACKLMLTYILFTLRNDLFVDQISSTIHHISKTTILLGS